MTEWRVWCESGDLVEAGLGSAAEAAEVLAAAAAEHVAASGCDGCGVLTAPGEHGFSVQVCEGGRDITGDYYEY